MSDFWKNKTVVVTGGTGFLGRVIVRKLGTQGAKKVHAPLHAEFDLTDMDAVKRMYERMKPDLVIHLAAVCGGIGANMERPADFFYDNLMMGVQLMEVARRNKVAKFVALGTICAYPKHTPVPFKEENLWDGYPEETNAPYGLAKKMLLVQAQAYRQQHGYNAIYLLPVNLYGPEDNFNLNTSHVIPAMIRKFIEARERGDATVTLWGTGNVSREFLFVEDAADAIIMASEKYDGADPVNIGSGWEIKIRDLADLVKKTTGFSGSIVWDSKKPDGQPQRRLDTTRAKKEFGFEAKVKLEEGVRRTVDWYLTTHSSSAKPVG